MKRLAFEEASWPRQFIAFTLDSALAYSAVFGVFMLVFGDKPDILSTRDFTIVMAINAMCFSLPSLIANATPGALLARCQFMKDDTKPAGWVLMLRGFYFFPLGVIVGGLHLPLKLLMNDQAPFDPIFGLQLMKRVPFEGPKSAVHPVSDTPPQNPLAPRQADMMIFGTNSNDLDTARKELERALSIRFTEHDSSFWGDYFKATGYGGTTLMLLPNTPDRVDEPPENASYTALFHVEASGSRATLISDLMQATAFERIR